MIEWHFEDNLKAAPSLYLHKAVTVPEKLAIAMHLMGIYAPSVWLFTKMEFPFPQTLVKLHEDNQYGIYLCDSYYLYRSMQAVRLVYREVNADSPGTVKSLIAHHAFPMMAQHQDMDNIVKNITAQQWQYLKTIYDGT